MTKFNDQHYQRVEEARHAEHAMRREQARAGDGTIEAEEAQRAAMLSVKYRRERDAARAEACELRRQLDEALAGSNQDTEEAARWLIRNPAYEAQS